MDLANKYLGLTNQQIVDAQKQEPCAHGTTRGNCGSSMCVVWEIEELNADCDLDIDPDAIPFPEGD